MSTTRQGGSKMGRPSKSPKDKYRQFPLKLPPELDNWLRAKKSADSNFNMNGFIADAIREKIGVLKDNTPS